MIEITERDIRIYVIKNSMFAIFWMTYFLLIFWMPLGGITGIEYVKALFSKSLNYNLLTTYAHPVLLIFYFLLSVYNLWGIATVIFSKKRFLKKEEESDSVYMKISSRPSISAFAVILLSIAFLFLSLNESDLSLNFGIAYSSFGVILGLFSMIAKGKSKGIVEQHKREVLDSSLKQMKEEYLKKTQSSADKAEDKINKLDIITQYKKMYDEGIITEEEFEKKKKDLLD